MDIITGLIICGKEIITDILFLGGNMDLLGSCILFADQVIAFILNTLALG